MIGFIPLPTNTEHTFNVFGARNPVLRDLRGDGQHLDPARPHPGRLGQLPRRRGPGQGLLPLPEELAAAGPREHEPDRPRRDLRDRGDLPLRPADQPLRPTFRQHPRRPPAAALHGRRARGPARDRRARRARPSRSPSSSSSSRSGLSPPCRHSSSRPSPLSTSAEPPPPVTDKEKEHFSDGPGPCHAAAERSPAKTSKPPAKRSPSASVPASARSAPVSASASSSVRRSSRSPASPR